VIKPSVFAKLGSPCCSLWGKSEIEGMAHDYVRALAANGDSWASLTPEQVLSLVPDPHYKTLWSSPNYAHWQESVVRHLQDDAGAIEVWRWRARPEVKESARGE